MKIHQVCVTYQNEQDRMLVRINTTDAEELRFWFTRRLLLGLWPMMNQALTEQLTRLEPGVTSGITAGEGLKKMLAEFRREALLQQADFQTPFRDQEMRLPLGEEPLLITDVKVSQTSSGGVQLDFAERLPGSTAPRSFKLELEPKLLQGVVHLVQQSLQHADWRLPEKTPEAVEPAGDTPEEAASGRPRYLN